MNGTEPSTRPARRRNAARGSTTRGRREAPGSCRLASRSATSSGARNGYRRTSILSSPSRAARDRPSCVAAVVQGQIDRGSAPSAPGVERPLAHEIGTSTSRGRSQPAPAGRMQRYEIVGWSRLGNGAEHVGRGGDPAARPGRRRRWGAGVTPGNGRRSAFRLVDTRPVELAQPPDRRCAREHLDVRARFVEERRGLERALTRPDHRGPSSPRTPPDRRAHTNASTPLWAARRTAPGRSMNGDSPAATITREAAISSPPSTVHDGTRSPSRPDRGHLPRVDLGNGPVRWNQRP